MTNMTPTTDKTVLSTITVVRFPSDEPEPLRLSGVGVLLGDAVAFAELPETPPELGPGVYPPVAAGELLGCIVIDVTVTVALCWAPKLPEGSRF